MNIDITNDSGQPAWPGWQAELTSEFAEFLLRALNIPEGSELSIAFVDEPTMSELHVQWLDEPGPTDVLSFPMDEMRAGCAEAGSLGDVVICPSVAAAQAAAAGHPERAEVELLLTHGVLHLLGHDHAEPEEHQRMFSLQAELLDQWAGVAR